MCALGAGVCSGERVCAVGSECVQWGSGCVQWEAGVCSGERVYAVGVGSGSTC